MRSDWDLRISFENGSRWHLSTVTVYYLYLLVSYGTLYCFLSMGIVSMSATTLAKSMKNLRAVRKALNQSHFSVSLMNQTVVCAGDC